jgi:protein-L-isoaspartate(D-aspartate) O-methyltransferase
LQKITSMMNFEQARFNMIEQQIRTWEVLDQDVLTLLNIVKREDFVPAAYRTLAFADIEVPLPDGQCMLEPKVEARFLQELAVRKHERVLEVGAGSGYMAALLAHRAASVLTLEISAELAQFAISNLKRASVMNVSVSHQDGSRFAREDPFDVIVLSGSVAEPPKQLLDMLKPGGRMGLIVGGEPVMQAQIITRTGPASFSSFTLFETIAPRLQNFAAPSAFKL